MTTSGLERAAALDASLEVLACPVCLRALHRADRGLRCDAGHAFDVAKQGYAALAVGSTVPGDTAPMVRARDAFLAAGHFAAIQRAVAGAVPAGTGWIADLACGTGAYLAAVLDAHPGRRGIGVDVSAPAARVAAGAHPRAAAATADLRTRVPLRSASVDAALVVFGPRDGAELARVLAPGGRAVVVVPRPQHLAELRGPFGTLGIDPDKQRRLDDRLRPLRRIGVETVEERRLLSAEDAARAVLMGPSGFHLDAAAVTAAAEALGPIEATVAVDVIAFAAEGLPATGTP